MNRKYYSPIKTIIFLLITIIIFYLLFLKIDFNILILGLKSIKINYLILALLISLFSNIFISSYKLKKILDIIIIKFSYLEALFIRLGTGPIKFVFPSNSGELLIAFYLKKKYKLKLRLGVLSFIIDKFYSLLSIWILLLVGLLFFDFKITFLLIACTLLGIFIIFKSRIFIYKFLSKVFEFVKKVKLKDAIYLLLISVSLGFSELINVFILFKAFNIDVPLSLILLFVPLSIIITKIPITILGLGTREATITFFFSQLASYEVLFSIGLLISFVEYIFPAGLGIFFINKFLNKTF